MLGHHLGFVLVFFFLVIEIIDGLGGKIEFGIRSVPRTSRDYVKTREAVALDHG